MNDYLLLFDGEAEAIAALPGLRISPTSLGGEPLQERWADTAMPVALVTADAVYGEPVDMAPVLISPRDKLPGFWLLTTVAEQPGQVAAIERESGAFVGDGVLAGARLDPAWAGGAGVLTLSNVEPPSEPVPEAISDRQFAQQLAILAVITEAEAIAWAARGDLPEAMEAAVAQLPEDVRFAARMLLSAATLYEFDHPLAPQLGALLGFSEAERREIWRAAALL